MMWNVILFLKKYLFPNTRFKKHNKQTKKIENSNCFILKIKLKIMNSANLMYRNLEKRKIHNSVAIAKKFLLTFHLRKLKETSVGFL